MKVSSLAAARVSDPVLDRILFIDRYYTDGHVHIWHKSTGIPIEKMDAHHPRCNAASWNPTDPCMFATCGDDGKVKM